MSEVSEICLLESGTRARSEGWLLEKLELEREDSLLEF